MQLDLSNYTYQMEKLKWYIIFTAIPLRPTD